MRCKQGDLAFINKALRPANVGRVVTCAEYLGYFIAGEIIVDQVLVAHTSDHWWRVVADSDTIETHYGFSNYAYLPDTWLTPIKPQPLDEDDVTDLDLNLALVDENGLAA